MKPHNSSAEVRLAVRCGFLTKAIWNEFFGCGKICWRNRIWKRLTESGVFLPHYANRACDVIVPNAEHPLVIRVSGGEISHAPSIAQLNHDEIIVRSFLTLLRSQTIEKAKFEAELKKEDLRSRRNYNPENKIKYPDLVIEFGGPARSKKIAVELELSRKEPKRYRQMMNTYMTSNQFSSVIFVTEIQTVKTSIKSAIEETFYPIWERPIGFVDLNDWSKNPSQAVISVGEKVTTLEKLRQSYATKA